MAGGGRGGQVGGQPKADYTYHQDTDSSSVSSVSDRNRLNTQDTMQVETVAGSNLVLLTCLLMPFTDPKDPVVHLGGVIGMAKGLSESRPGHLQPCVWCFCVVQELSFNVQQKKDFSSYAIRIDFYKSSHNYQMSKNSAYPSKHVCSQGIFHKEKYLPLE